MGGFGGSSQVTAEAILVSGAVYRQHWFSRKLSRISPQEPPSA